MLVRSAPVGVLSKICKSPSVVEILFSALHCGEREFLRATALNIYIDTCLPLSSAFVLLHTSGYFIFYV